MFPFNGASQEATFSMFNVPWRRARLLRNQNVVFQVQLEKVSGQDVHFLNGDI